MNQAFAVWLTGLPASGKSAIAKELSAKLKETGLVVEVLESDAVRRYLTPEPSYERKERDFFYRALAFFGSRLVKHGVPVVFDATGNRQAYRDLARSLIPHFLEVAVQCPLETCLQRDHKGTYSKGVEGKSFMVPGLQDPYEAPLKPDVEIQTTVYSPDAAAAQIIKVLEERGYLRAARDLVDREIPM
jgi:adenylylsulfate kinase